MKINCMELLRKSGKMVSSFGGSSNMAREKVTRHLNLQMEESTIISARMVSTTVTEFKHTVMEEYIEESSKI